MLKTLLLYYHTIKYLTWIQIKYQLWYKIRKIWRKITHFNYTYDRDYPDFKRIEFIGSIKNPISYQGYQKFTFLNIERCFENDIDWDFADFGKLWTYNLNYFEYLNQDNANVSQEDYTKILDNFVQKLPVLNNANEPFPTSLRIINWIKYFTRNNIYNEKYLRSLYSQLYILTDNKEYHLLGNHLLENGFALVFGGLFFQDHNIFQQGASILKKELDEQILDDGAHFELSPMYHCLMLYRILDTIGLITNYYSISGQYSNDYRSLEDALEEKANWMIGWLKAIQFNNNAIPRFNDSTDGIAPPVDDLIEYARLLGIQSKPSTLSESGYRRLKSDYLDIVIKAGKIGSDYIPGHAHADTLTFELYAKNNPWIVDPGISTYEANPLRQMERSTVYHNTVTVSGRNTSQIWSAFRVARKEKSRILKENLNQIVAQRTDFHQTKHKRTWMLDDKILTILDESPTLAQAYFHFHPKVTLIIKDNRIYTNHGHIEFIGHTNIEIKNYSYCISFNKTIISQKVIITFPESLKTQFYIEDLVS
ncbi:MAG: heparinase II/III family protein [Chitinophagales bacterium]|nr:heparinase II/III family protein [Chitinophagales bacterium]